MLGTLRKDNFSSTDYVHYFPVNYSKSIAVETTGSGRILSIRLHRDMDKNAKDVTYEARSVIYLEDITIGDDLDLDALWCNEDLFWEVLV